MWIIFEAKGIDKVTERLSGSMVIIAMGPVATSVVDYLFGFKALYFRNWVIELALQICIWSSVCHPVLP